jgi:hypothetical protein
MAIVDLLPKWERQEMKIQPVLMFTLLSIATIISSVSITFAQTKSSDSEWVDPIILKQLQDIQPVDRRKIKPDRLRQIALQLTKDFKNVSIVLGDSQTVLPELNIPHQKMLVVTGKTTTPTNVKGIVYPIDLERQAFYDENGNIVATSTTLPPDSPSQSFRRGIAK